MADENIQENASMKTPFANNAETPPSYPPIGQRRRMFAPLMAFTLCFYIGVIGWTILLPQYILHRLHVENDVNSSINTNGCDVNESDAQHQMERKLQKRAAEITSAATFAGGVPCVISVLIFSSISDQLGRKVTIIVPFVGGLIVVVAIAVMVAFNLPFWVYIAASFVNGLSGSTSTLIAGIFSSVADVTPPERRSIAIGIIEGTLGLSMLVANLVVGFWAKIRGYEEPIIFLAALIATSGIFHFFIHETRPRNRDEGENRVGCCGTIQKQWKHMSATLSVDRRRAVKLILLVIGFSLSMLTYTGVYTVLPLYVTGQPFCWDSSKIGAYNAVKTAVIVVGTTIGLVIMRRKISDLGLTFIGTVSFIGIHALTGVASFFPTSFHNVIMGIAIGVGLLSSLHLVTFRALGSKAVSADEQGAVFGLIAVGEAFSINFGPVIMNGVFSATVATMNWFVYFLSAGLVFIELMIVFVLKIFFYSSQSEYVELVGSLNADAKESED